MFSKTIIVGHLGARPGAALHEWWPARVLVLCRHQPELDRSKRPAAGKNHLVSGDRLGQVG